MSPYDAIAIKYTNWVNQPMAEDFLCDTASGGNSGGDDHSSNRNDDREPVRLTVSGSDRGITHVIHQLYRIGFAQVHEWSKPQRHPQTGNLFCILTKYLRPE